MPSLYHHEKLVHEYAALEDVDILSYAAELRELRKRTDNERQLGVIARYLTHLTWEVEQRLLYDGKKGE